jgi:uncharacterized protein (DUF58 family)
VREFTAEDERRVHVVLDTRTTNASAGVEPATSTRAKDVAKRYVRQGSVAREGDESSARFERGVTLAASLVAHFIEERAEVRLTLGADVGNYGAGREHLYASLRRLALVVPDMPTETNGRDAHAQGTRPRVAHAQPAPDFWETIARASNSADANYAILLTTAAPGTIPAHLWRQSHVIYL